MILDSPTPDATGLAVTIPFIKVGYLDDGTPFNEDTGEILDLASPDVLMAVQNQPAAAEVRQRWEVTDDEGAEWCLKRLGDLEATVVKIKAQREAIMRNFDKLLAEADRRIKWWHYRFAGSLVEFAKATLGKTKTRRWAHGSVSFRESKGRREILSMEAAQEFVERWKPELIRRTVLPVRLSDIDAAIQAATEATEDPAYLRPAFLLIEGQKTNTTIKTGIANSLEDKSL